MALEVSRLIKSESKRGLITRDFLGGCSGIDSKELDLDLHVPSGWEKHLDLKSGKVYIQRSSPANTVSSSEHRSFTNQISSKLQDLRCIPQTLSSSSSSLIANPTLNLLDKPSLDLKLISNCPPSSYSSVCTLDKVKSALDRVDRSSPSTSSSSRKRMLVGIGGSQAKCSSSPSNSSSLSMKETEDEVEKASSDQSGLLVAAACSECFLYVLISKNDPKCPKCNSVVQLPVMPTTTTKKPKIDLNISM